MGSAAGDPTAFVAELAGTRWQAFMRSPADFISNHERLCRQARANTARANTDRHRHRSRPFQHETCARLFGNITYIHISPSPPTPPPHQQQQLQVTKLKCAWPFLGLLACTSQFALLRLQIRSSPSTCSSNETISTRAPPPIPSHDHLQHHHQQTANNNSNSIDKLGTHSQMT